MPVSALAALESSWAIRRRSSAKCAWALGHIGPKAVGGLRKALADAESTGETRCGRALGRLANREEDFEQVRTALPNSYTAARKKNSQLRNAALGVFEQAIVNPEDTKVGGGNPAGSDGQRS